MAFLTVAMISTTVICPLLAELERCGKIHGGPRKRNNYLRTDSVLIVPGTATVPTVIRPFHHPSEARFMKNTATDARAPPLLGFVHSGRLHLPRRLPLGV